MAEGVIENNVSQNKDNPFSFSKFLQKKDSPLNEVETCSEGDRIHGM